MFWGRSPFLPKKKKQITPVNLKTDYTTFIPYSVTNSLLLSVQVLLASLLNILPQFIVETEYNL